VRIALGVLAGAAVLAVVSCGGKPERQVANQEVLASEEPVTVDTVAMPEYPEGRRGYLVARSAGGYLLDGAWPAQAAICEDPPVLQVLAQQPGFGTLILLQLPPAAERLTEYPIAIVDSGMPVPPASQIGVQVFQDRNSYAFQGLSGGIELYGFGDRVSGRFAVTLREIQTDNEAKYAGVFEEIPIEPLAEEMCQAMMQSFETPDSLRRFQQRQ